MNSQDPLHWVPLARMSLKKSRATWLVSLSTYSAFAAEHGCGEVAYIKNFNKSLANWTNRTKSELRAGKLSPEQVIACEEVGILPAQKAVRRAATDVKLSREKTMNELRQFVLLHGHAHIPADNAKSSLYARVKTLRSIAKQRDPALLQRLKSLGAFVQFPDSSWERDFTAWKSYVESTGDFRCAANPPDGVLAWAIAVDRQLALLSTPQPWLSCDRKHLKKFSQERACVLGALSRLGAAGFTLKQNPLTQSDLVAAKLLKSLALPLRPLPLRVVLRILTNRRLSGLLADNLIRDLDAAGIMWCSAKNKWRQTSTCSNISGAFIRSDTEQVPDSDGQKSVKATPASHPAQVPAPVWMSPPAQAIAECIAAAMSAQLILKTTERQLLRHPTMQPFRASLGTPRFRSELRVAVSHLYNEQKITYLQGFLAGVSWSPFVPVTK